MNTKIKLYMKRLNYIISLLLLLFVSSCSDFLEEVPKTQLSKENIYNSRGTALGALNGCYAKMASYNGYSFEYMHLLSVTSGLGVSIKMNDKDLASMRILTTNIMVNKAYMGLYDPIRCANDIIDGMKSSTLTDEALKDRVVGEAELIRGLSYFNLVRLFGPVCLVTSIPENYASSQAPRATEEEVYKQVISDLEDAFAKLPEPGEQDPGRPHKYAAQALLAKVYVTLAGDDETSEYWQKAYNAGLDVVQNGQYKLVSNYANLFGSGNNNNSESIFEIQFAATQGGSKLTETTCLYGYDAMPNSTGSRTWGKTRPNKYYYELFDDRDPRKQVTFISQSYKNIFDNKKYMLYPTIKGTDEAKGMKYKRGDSEYAAWKKYLDPTLVTTSNCNFVYYRYADLLLLLAESANELDKKDEAITYLNLVIDRAKDINGDGSIDSATETYPVSVDASISKEEFRDRVMLENLLELSGECHEWYTLRRRGTRYLKEMVQGNNAILDQLNNLPALVYRLPDSDEDLKRNLHLPYPQDEINRNEKVSQEDQNWGY